MANFEEAIAEISKRVENYKGTLETEEATKNALIMPFIAKVFGYDVFNPEEVVPEFTCDVGIKKGEKIDYAIMKEGKVQIIIEAKSITDTLRRDHASQLVRYFSVTDARIGILTNGQLWEFYTDLDKPNIMDSIPFLTLDLLDPLKSPVSELKKLAKDSFDVESVIASAEELKYVSAFKKLISVELDNPSPEFVKVLARQVFEGTISARMLEFFTGIVKRSATSIVNERVNDRLKTALGDVSGVVPVSAPDVSHQSATSELSDNKEDEYETTEEEMQAFYIVKSILGEKVGLERVFHRDRKLYFSVIFDNNDRKPICKFWFNAKKAKYVSLFDAEKVETKVGIETLNDIYSLSSELRAVVDSYLASGAAG